MNEKKQSPLFGVGGVTLFTVLLVLVLTMFAVLTVSSAQADMRLSQKNALAVSEYYAADSKAVQLLAKVEALWPGTGQQPTPELVLQGLDTDYFLDISEWDDKLTIFAAIPINDHGQILQTALTHAGLENPAAWQVEQWQFVPPVTVVDDEFSLSVWLGE